MARLPAVGCCMMMMFLASCAQDITENKPGIILVPGVMGSRLWSDTKDVWVNKVLLATGIVENYLALDFDADTSLTSNPYGKTTGPDFGVLEDIEYMSDGSLFSAAKEYMHPLVEKFVGLGYTRDSDIRGAPYDWRKSPNELEDFYQHFTTMIETTRATTNGPVVVIAHSYGGLVTNYFLQSQSTQWKQENVEALITLGSPFGGSTLTLQALTTGQTPQTGTTGADMFKRLTRSFPSSYMLMPSANVYPDDVLIVSPSQTYTLQNIKDYLTNQVGADSVAMRELANDMMTKASAAPGVKTYCLYGDQTPTMSSVVFPTDEFVAANAEFQYNNFGDGTVGVRSLQACDSFEQAELVESIAYNATHNGMLSDADVWAKLLQVIAEISDSRS